MSIDSDPCRTASSTTTNAPKSHVKHGNMPHHGLTWVRETRSSSTETSRPQPFNRVSRSAQRNPSPKRQSQETTSYKPLWTQIEPGPGVNCLNKGQISQGLLRSTQGLGLKERGLGFAKAGPLLESARTSAYQVRV